MSKLGEELLLMANLKTAEELCVTGTNSARWVRWWGIRTYIELKIEPFYSSVSDRKCKYSIGHYKFRVFKFRSTLISQNFLNRETHENNV